MLKDKFGREVDYLRVSVTEKCNFRCSYCMPDTPLNWEPKENLLSMDELFTVVKTAIDNGIKKVRITGGEPLIRKDLDNLIKNIFEYSPETEINLTSNGYYLKELAGKLKEAGLKRVNLSLDTLQKDKFLKISKIDGLQQVLDGIDEALRVGLKIKLNMVPMKDINDDEIIDILEYSRKKGVAIRYIEYMTNSHAKDSVIGLKAEEILEVIKKTYKFTKETQEIFGPATLYTLDENSYRFGIIQPHDETFCKSCNRLRMTANGSFIPCLFYDDSLNIKEPLRANDMKKVEEILKRAVDEKPEKNLWDENESSDRAFYQTGG